MRRVFNLRLLLFVLLALWGAGMVDAVRVHQSAAVSAGDWQAGRIIDQGVFRNSNSMSVQQIQDFLNAKDPTCDTWGSQPSEYGGGTRAQYGTSRGYPPPYTCLKDYYENPSTHQTNYGGAAIPDGAYSAAQMISIYSKAFNINPQVVLVLLQKEQRLVTDDWPWTLQYRTATGYGCPDSAPCDSQYYGFANQVRWAVHMYQAIMDQDPNWFTPYTTGTNFVLWNPNQSCGGSNVNISALPTAALYSYTPYQPNQAALNNLYGTGDGCSSYGNRNFWVYFNDWFGDTHDPGYSWEIQSQNSYTDETLGAFKDTTTLMPGQRAYIVLKAKNTGTVTWKNSGSVVARLATTQAQDRTSAFQDPSWFSYNRPAVMQESTVAPGGTGTFAFWYTAPRNPGGYTEHFSLVDDGASWLNDPGFNIFTNVIPWQNKWQIQSQTSYTDQTMATQKDSTYLKPGEKAYISIKAKNVGNSTWSNTGTNAVHLGTDNPRDQASPFQDPSWLSPNRPAAMQESSVTPGGTGTFNFWYTAPAQTSTYRQYFDLVSENNAWFDPTGLNVYTVVVPQRYEWQIQSQTSYTDQTMAAQKDSTYLHPGDRIYVVIKALNSGNMTWTNSGSGALSVGTQNPQDRVSAFADNTWLAPNRPVRMQESSVAPGQVGTFAFWYKAPAQTGTYREYFSLVAENLTWLNNPGLNVYTVVQ